MPRGQLYTALLRGTGSLAAMASRGAQPCGKCIKGRPTRHLGWCKDRGGCKDPRFQRRRGGCASWRPRVYAYCCWWERRCLLGLQEVNA